RLADRRPAAAHPGRRADQRLLRGHGVRRERADQRLAARRRDRRGPCDSRRLHRAVPLAGPGPRRRAAGTSRVNPALIASLAAAGLLAGWPQRAVITRLDVSPRPPALAAGAVTAVLLGALEGSWSALVRALLGGLALAGFYLLLMVISPSGMSLGDVKLAASLGTLLAWFGWRLLLAGGFAGFLLGGIYGIALLASGRATRKQPIPFGPFMIAGAVLAVAAWPR